MSLKNEIVSLCGDYCFVDFKKVEENKWNIAGFRWDYVGSDSVLSNDREKISRYLCNAPLLNDNLYATLDMACEWIRNKDVVIRIAKCFLAGKENPENPIYKDLKEGIIDNFSHDSIWLHTEILENYWRIISVKWDLLSEVMEKIWDDFKFKTALDLMKAIIDSEYTQPFINFVSSTYKEVSTRQNRDMWKLLSKTYSDTLTDKESKRLNRYLKQHRKDNNWSDRLHQVCYFIADNKDTYIATHITIHEHLCAGSAKLNLRTFCGDPKLNQYRPLTHSWQHGHVVRLNNV